MSKEKTTSGGVSIVTILQAIFLVSKIFQIGVCKDWSWWWILSPLWIAFGLAVVIIVIAVIIKAIVES